MSWSINVSGPSREVVSKFRLEADKADTYLRQYGASEEAQILHRVVAIVDVACSTCKPDVHMLVQANGHGNPSEGSHTVNLTMHPIAPPIVIDNMEPVAEPVAVVEEVQEPAAEPLPEAPVEEEPKKTKPKRG